MSDKNINIDFTPFYAVYRHNHNIKQQNARESSLFISRSFITSKTLEGTVQYLQYMQYILGLYTRVGIKVLN